MATEETDLESELVERVAAIDVAKASGMVCTRVPHESGAGRRVQGSGTSRRLLRASSNSELGCPAWGSLGW